MKYHWSKNACSGAFLVLLLTLAGCKEEDFQASRSDDSAALSTLRIELENMAGQKNCNASIEWGIMAMTSSTCKNPFDYIAYDKKVDAQELAKKLTAYIRKREAFDIKWNKGLTCYEAPVPKNVECVNGKPKLVY